MPNENYAPSPTSGGPPPFLTVAEVADKLRISKMTVRRLCDDGTLTGYRFGRSIRIDPRDLVDYVRANTIGGDQ